MTKASLLVGTLRLMMFLNAATIPRPRKTSRSHGDVSNSRSRTQPINAPPTRPPISSARTLLPRRDPSSACCSVAPCLTFSACSARAIRSSSEAIRASSPAGSCPGVSAAMPLLRDHVSRRHGACGCTRQGAARLERGLRIVNHGCGRDYRADTKPPRKSATAKFSPARRAIGWQGDRARPLLLPGAAADAIGLPRLQPR